MAANVSIDVRNVDQVKRVLKIVEPELSKELTVKFRDAGNVIARDARAKTPKRTGASRRSIRVLQGGKKIGSGSRGRRRLAGFRVVQKAKGGSIIEFAKNAPSGKKQAISLVRNLTAKYGSPGRFMWAAYDRNKQVVDMKFQSAVSDAERKLNTKLGL